MLDADPAPFHAEFAEAPDGAQAFWLTAADGARIRAAVWPGGEKGHVLLFNGRTEYIEKYGRVISRLVAEGYGVATLDWRGQGLSDRPGAPERLGYVRDFADYQNDVDALLAAPQVMDLTGPRAMIAHSMGGCICLRALVDGRITPDRAIFSGPMWGLDLSPSMSVIARALSALAQRFGFAGRPAPGGGGGDFGVFLPFKDNPLTTDEEHYLWFRTHLEAVPALGLGAPTLHWLHLALREMRALSTRPTPDIDVMTLLGADEAIVAPKAIRDRAAASTSMRVADIPKGRHETLMEAQDSDIGRKVWAEVLGFLKG